MKKLCIIFMLISVIFAGQVFAENKNPQFYNKIEKNITEHLEILIFNYIDEDTVSFLREKSSLNIKKPSFSLKDSDMLSFFLKNKTAVFVYDITALPLLKNNNLYWYPIYKDTVGIITDEKNSILDIEDLYLKKSVSVIKDSPYIYYADILFQRSYKESYIDFLTKLNNLHKLDLTDESDVKISMYSWYLNRKTDKKFTFLKNNPEWVEVGILSYYPISERNIKNLKKAFAEKNYPVEKNAGVKSGYINEYISKLVHRQNEFIKIRRKILGEHKDYLKSSVQNILLTVFFIFLLLILIKYLKTYVVIKVVRRIMVSTAYVLILWLFESVVKYGIPSYEHDIIRYLWYAYYIFMPFVSIMILTISLYADKYEDSPMPLALKINISIYILLVLLVMTNDFHRLVFTFTGSNRALWHGKGNYGYNIGYYFVFAYITFTILVSSLILIKKKLDSPNKLRLIYPLIVAISGITYAVMYAKDFKPFTEIPLVFFYVVSIGMYMVSMVFSRLALVNGDYVKSFKNSMLDVQIFDNENKLMYSTLGNKKQKSGLFLSTTEPVKGGYAVIKEDISDVIKSRNTLLKTEHKLKRNKMILETRLKFDEKIDYIEEEIALFEHINSYIRNRTERLLEELKKSGKSYKMNVLLMNIIFIKRKAEMMIKLKNVKFIEDIELKHLITELATCNPDVAVLIDIKGDVSIFAYTFVYTVFFEILEFITEKTDYETYIKVKVKDEKALLSFAVDKTENPALTDEINGKFKNILFKDNEDALICTIERSFK